MIFQNRCKIFVPRSKGAPLRHSPDFEQPYSGFLTRMQEKKSAGKQHFTMSHKVFFTLSRSD